MDSQINRFVEDIFKIKVIHEYQFRQVFGFTFAFKREEVIINGQLSSAEIKPVAIIYEENDQYWLAPLDVVDEIGEVVKQFVEKSLQQNI